MCTGVPHSWWWWWNEKSFFLIRESTQKSLFLAPVACVRNFHEYSVWVSGAYETEKFLPKSERKMSASLDTSQLPCVFPHKKGTSKFYRVQRNVYVLTWRGNLLHTHTHTNVSFKVLPCNSLPLSPLVVVDSSLKVFPLTFTFSVIAISTTFIIKRIAWDFLSHSLSLYIRMIMLSTLVRRPWQWHACVIRKAFREDYLPLVIYFAISHFFFFLSLSSLSSIFFCFSFFPLYHPLRPPALSLECLWKCVGCGLRARVSEGSGKCENGVGGISGGRYWFFNAYTYMGSEYCTYIY